MSGILSAVIPMADYLAIEALSSGACKALATGSPYAWRNRVETASPAMSLGTLAHLAILEPDRFAAAVVQPNVDLRTNAGKESLVEWLVGIVGEPLVLPPEWAAVGTVLDLYLKELRPRLAASGLAVLTAEQRDLCQGMRDAVMARCAEDDKMDAAVNSDGMNEITGIVTDPEYNIPVKVRPDRLLSGAPIVVSLKTTQSVGEREYRRTALAYGWNVSSAFYCRALESITGERHKYVEIAVESAPPHDVMICEYLGDVAEWGESAMRQGMETYRRCTESGIWPGTGYSWDANEYTIVQIGRKEVTL